MAQTSVCPICKKRRPERFCPALVEKICAICCGTERERSLDCPSDCVYLIKAHRYEQEHRQPLTAAEMPFADAELARGVIYEQQALVSGLAQAILKFADEQRFLADPDVLSAVMALAETYRTLTSGIYYEKLPGAALSAALYSALSHFIQEYKKQSASVGFSGVKDSAIFAVLVYLFRICRSSMNGRPRSRLFLDLLRAGTPQAQQKEEEPSRIIMP
jgi:hypothetical protein